MVDLHEIGGGLDWLLEVNLGFALLCLNRRDMTQVSAQEKKITKNVLDESNCTLKLITVSGVASLSLAHTSFCRTAAEHLFLCAIEVEPLIGLELSKCRAHRFEAREYSAQHNWADPMSPSPHKNNYWTGEQMAQHLYTKITVGLLSKWLSIFTSNFLPCFNSRQWHR